MGTLANKRLRAWRAHFHREFDVLWRGESLYKVFSRGQAYSWLAKEMKLSKAQCHIGLFNEAQCIVGIKLVQRYKEELAKASVRDNKKG